MSSKKIIFGIILSMILFGFFMRFTLVSMQKEEIDLTTYEYIKASERLEEGIEILEGNKGYEFLEDFYIEDVSILMIDHLTSEAVIWSNEDIKSIKYLDIPENVIKANSFFLEINGVNTVLINTDKLLGDLEERLISDSYRYLNLSQDKLNPFEIDYFPSEDENIKLRYFRNMIINELINANKENEGLEKAKYFFDEWEEYDGNNYNFVSHYDVYEGYQEYLKLKVKENMDKDFSIYDYIESKRNKFGFFYKEDEYKIIGALLIMYSINNDIELIRSNQTDNNIYKNLLYKTPVIKYQGNISYEEFESNYKKWMENLPEIIHFESDELKNTFSAKFSYKDIVTEKYDYTYKINTNYYLYFNYCARFIDNSTIEKEYIIVRITPNMIEYYYEF